MSLNTLNCCLFIYLLSFIDILCCANARLYWLYCLLSMFEMVDSNCLLRCRCITSVFFYRWISMYLYTLCIWCTCTCTQISKSSLNSIIHFFFFIFHFVCAIEEITYLSYKLRAWWFKRMSTWKEVRKAKKAYVVFRCIQYRCKGGFIRASQFCLRIRKVLHWQKSTASTKLFSLFFL